MDNRTIHVIFSVYIDESGTQEDRLIIAACVSREYKWVDWERGIKELQLDSGIERLHTVEIFNELKKKFPEKNNQELRQAKHIVDTYIAANLLECCDFGIVATVLISDYEMHYLRKRGLPFKIRPESRYRLCLKYAIDNLMRRLWTQHGPDISRIVFFIEGGNEHTPESLETYFQFRRLSMEPVKSIMGDSLSVIDNSEKQNRRLFAVDFLANHTLRFERKGILLDGRMIQHLKGRFRHRSYRIGLTPNGLRRMRKLTIEYARQGREFF